MPCCLSLTAQSIPHSITSVLFLSFACFSFFFSLFSSNQMCIIMYRFQVSRLDHMHVLCLIMEQFTVRRAFHHRNMTSGDVIADRFEVSNTNQCQGSSPIATDWSVYEMVKGLRVCRQFWLKILILNTHVKTNCILCNNKNHGF